MSNTSAKEPQQQNALTTQIKNVNNANDNLQKEIKKVINSLVIENSILKRENAKLKVANNSKA